MNDSTRTDELWFQERIPLIGHQMLTAQRVMERIGHECGTWGIPLTRYELAELCCRSCPARATIQLVDGQEGAEYTVLILPPGCCPQGDAHA